MKRWLGLFAILAILALAAAAIRGFVRPAPSAEDCFDKIKNGMSEAEVVAIIGRDGVPSLAEEPKRVTWLLADKHAMTIDFDDKGRTKDIELRPVKGRVP